MRLGHDPLDHALVQGPCHRRCQQLAGIGVPKPVQLQLGEPGELVGPGRIARGERQDDRFGLQPAADESEHLRRDPVEPLRVVDQAEEGTILGGVGQQAERREADEEPIRGRAEP